MAVSLARSLAQVSRVLTRAPLNGDVSQLLNRFLAPYIENLNTEQLNLNLWSGASSVGSSAILLDC